MATLDQSDLPRDLIHPASWGDIYRVLAGTLLFLLLMNGAVSWCFKHSRSLNRDYWVLSTKWKMALDPQRPVDWLILGDSSGNQGVVPQVLNERLGVRSVNLCTIGSMLAVGDAWMLESYIQRRGAPRGVLLVHVYDMWDREGDGLVSSMASIPLPWGFWSRFTPPVHVGAREQLRLFLLRYVPLYSGNHSLSRALQWPWKLEKYHVQIQEDGYMPWFYPSPDDVDADFLEHRNALKRLPKFRLSQLNQQALARLRELADTHGFTLYLANSPLYEGVYQESIFQSYFEQVRKNLQAFAATSPRIHYIAQTPALFSKNEMANADHLIDASAQRYTRRLADEILASEQFSSGKDVGGPASPRSDHDTSHKP